MNGILLEIDKISWDGLETNLAAVVFEDWCDGHGIEANPEGLTDGQPNLLRFAFDRPEGPLPMPTFDLSGETAVVVMPYLRHVVSVALVGSESLSAPIGSWYSLRRSDDDATRWFWDGENPSPESLFIRYKAER